MTETIQNLNSRVQELEEQNVLLQGAVGDSINASLPGPEVGAYNGFSDASDFTPTPSPTPSTDGRELDPDEWTVEGVLKLLPQFNGGITLASPQVSDYIWELISSFNPVATQFGFFLDRDHFATLAVVPSSDPTRPCEALIAAVCLWGCHISPPDSPFSSVEEQMLKVALHQRSLMIISKESNARRILHSVQAEILMAFYYYRRGILLEAKVHAATAATYVTGAGMQSTFSMNNEVPRELDVVEEGYASYLPPPRTVPEMGELINGFWAAYAIAHQLASVSTTADCTEIFDAPHLQINCPWPLDMNSYREGKLPTRISGTVNAFLNCNPLSPQRNAQHDSYLAMLTKSTVLLRRATVLTDANTPQTHASSEEEVEHLSSLINDYRSTLPPVVWSNPELRSVYISRALSSTAHLRLHREKALLNVEKDLNICMAAIRDIFIFCGECDLSTLECVSPVLGGIWKDACLFIAKQLETKHSEEEERGELRAMFAFGRKVMETHAKGNNVLMQYQLKNIPESI